MSSLKNVVTASIGKESTTKAAWLWQALHSEREFSAAYVNAVLENNHDAVAEALEIIDMLPEDVDLSEEEFSAFACGLTPSGGLEVTAWEGYYLTDPLPDGKVFALLICSFDNRVYWGPEEGFANKYWSKHEVNYHLGPHATLCFSSTAGEVALSFSRDLDEETGRFGKNTVKGTVGGTAISAAQTTPPIPPPLVDPFFNRNDDPAEDQHFLLGDGWKLFTATMSVVAPFVGLTLWCCTGLRRRCYQYAWELRRKVNETAEYCLRLENSRFSYTWVDLSLAQERLTTEVIQKLNGELRDREVNFETDGIEHIIYNLKLKEYTRTQLEESIRKFVQERLAVIAQEVHSDLPTDLAKEFEKRSPEWVKNKAQARTETVMENFEDTSLGINSIVQSTVLKAYKEFYRSKVEDHTHELKAINDLVEETQKKINGWQEDVEYWKEVADKLEDDKHDATTERARIRELEREIDKGVEENKQREKDRTEIEYKKTEAEREHERHDAEIKEHDSDWKKEAEKHIK
ncbi:hypothetical protein JOM56_005652 [Amanita muscaria]